MTKTRFNKTVSLWTALLLLFGFLKCVSGISCPSPPNVPNGYFKGNGYYAGNEITLVCNRGYYFPGGRNRFRCTYAGVWSERSRMNCFAVNCGRPTPIKNGKIVGRSFYYQSKVEFSCNNGYILQGSRSATCLHERRWSDPTPICQVVPISSEAQKLLEKFQNSFFRKYANFTGERKPPPGPVSKARSHSDSISYLDLIFALDTSGSIGKTKFNIVKNFTLNIGKEFAMDRNSIQMGAVAFGTKVYLISNLTANKTDFLKEVNAFDYKAGGTATTSALRRVLHMFDSSTRSNAVLKRVLILITDGNSNSRLNPNSTKPESLVPEFAQRGVERFVFGVGKIYEPELRAIASPPYDNHKFDVANFQVFKEFVNSITSKLADHRCGLAGAGGLIPQVLNGKPSSYGAWPWLASIYIRNTSTQNFTQQCGGALINERWIVSAAHCVYQNQNDLPSIKIKLGDYDRNNDNDLYEQIFDVEKMELGGNSSQMYTNQSPYPNDIVLIKLNSSASYNSYVRPICLLQADHHNASMAIVGELATVVGWGSVRVNDPTFASSPFEATVTILDNSECDGQWGKQVLTNDMLCARGHGTDTCQGDSGGPLMCQSEDDEVFTLCGIVSSGTSEHCDSQSYGVYTKVYNFINHIKRVIGA